MYTIFFSSSLLRLKPTEGFLLHQAKRFTYSTNLLSKTFFFKDDFDQENPFFLSYFPSLFLFLDRSRSLRGKDLLFVLLRVALGGDREGGEGREWSDRGPLIKISLQFPRPHRFGVVLRIFYCSREVSSSGSVLGQGKVCLVVAAASLTTLLICASQRSIGVVGRDEE